MWLISLETDRIFKKILTRAVSLDEEFFVKFYRTSAFGFFNRSAVAEVCALRVLLLSIIMIRMYLKSTTLHCQALYDNSSTQTNNRREIIMLKMKNETTAYLLIFY